MLPIAALRACSLLAFLLRQGKLHSEAASHLELHAGPRAGRVGISPMFS
jgi:hypothetical protein